MGYDVETESGGGKGRCTDDVHGSENAVGGQQHGEYGFNCTIPGHPASSSPHREGPFGYPVHSRRSSRANTIRYNWRL